MGLILVLVVWSGVNVCVVVLVLERWKRITSSQWGVWGKRSTGTAITGTNGVPFTRRDGRLQRLGGSERERRKEKGGE